MEIGAGSERPFRVVVPLDAERAEGFLRVQPVKIVARCGGRIVTSAPVRFDGRGRGVATLTFGAPPGRVELLVGPGDASDEELERLRTLTCEIRRPPWVRSGMTLPPLRIPDYWWSWWRSWCRITPLLH